MRIRRIFGALVEFLVLLFGGAGVVGCASGADHLDCTAVAPGTPLASLPAVGQVSYVQYCWRLTGPADEVKALDCCSRPEWACPRQGTVDCAKLEPFETWRVGLPYGEWTCPAEPDWPVGYGYNCFVWVRNGRVVGSCGGCTPD